MSELRHFTLDELEAYRRRAVRACIEHEMALLFNQRLDENGIPRVASESWSARLIRKLAKPFQVFPLFSVSE